MEEQQERSYVRAMLVLTVVLAVLAAVVAALLAIVGGDDEEPSPPADPVPWGTPSPQPAPGAPTLPPVPSPPPAPPPEHVAGRSPVPGRMTLPGAPEACPEPGVEVATAEQLQAALDDAGPGSVIHLADGVYEGHFSLSLAAGPADPAWLCGGPAAVLDGGGPDSGYTLHLEGADHWTVHGLLLRGGQKGLVADGVTGVRLTGLTVHSTGDEAIHLRRHSSDNVVAGNVISDTGLRTAEYGEGIYVGSSHNNWCELTDCEPDTSDGNRIAGNVIFATTAEPVDIKEGTTGGVLAGNQLDGAAITGEVPDSWVALKGNDWSVVDNEGRHSPGDGFQVTTVGPEGWGRGNTLARNTGTLEVGDAVLVAVVEGNTVACSNELRGGSGSVSNRECAD